MRTLPWAAPAMLLACLAGCGREPSAPTKAPNTPPTKAETAAVAATHQVTLHVEGMV